MSFFTPLAIKRITLNVDKIDGSLLLHVKGENSFSQHGQMALALWAPT